MALKATSGSFHSLNRASGSTVRPWERHTVRKLSIHISLVFQARVSYMSNTTVVIFLILSLRLPYASLVPSGAMGRIGMPREARYSLAS